MKLISLCLIILFSCSDKSKSPAPLAGTYDVRVDLNSKTKEAIQSVKDSVQLALQKAREEMRNTKIDIDLNVSNIDTSSTEGKIEYVAKSLVKQLSDTLHPNLGLLADGISELVAGTSNIGLNLVETMMNLVSIEVSLNEDGTISTNQEMIKSQFNTDFKWKQEGNNFILIDNNGNSNQSFAIQNRTESGFDLTNEEINLQFRKKNK